MQITLMSGTKCPKPSHNEICSGRNRPESLGKTLGHMVETDVIAMTGGSMLQIGKKAHSPRAMAPIDSVCKSLPQKSFLLGFSVQPDG